ncbi:hypothetical protein LX81_02427 [Palleronia aestuarii]|uniref:Arginine transporter n=1 Tax=Palleronia aestuarii TaxID=568105 RepID=A0A2W7NGG7_9RHOB|nr:hypothetical protein [Palleronia aestuarii]PZX15794.1 hypothetical protein LX81_02427 [Palleronia aestuarii]
MKKFLTMAVLAGVAAGCGQAGVIERACLSSERANTNRQVCDCIQHVADMTLDRRDQKLAATFFEDPHRAQEIRTSDSTRDETFWRKYSSFGSNAESYCN